MSTSVRISPSAGPCSRRASRSSSKSSSLLTCDLCRRTFGRDDRVADSGAPPTEAWGYAGEELIHIFGFATKVGITRPDIRETVYRVSLTLFADIKGNAR